MTEREFDIIVYGASGFTGRLVAEYLSREYAGDASLKWAMAGRSEKKLAEVRDEIGASKSTPLVTADASEPASLDAMARRARSIGAPGSSVTGGRRVPCGAGGGRRGRSAR